MRIRLVASVGTLVALLVAFQNCGHSFENLPQDVQYTTESKDHSTGKLLSATQASGGCNVPVKHYQFTLNQDVYLGHAIRPVFQVQLPGSGRAFAKWTGNYFNSAPDIHSWQSYVLVGNSILSGNFQLGDGVYPQSGRTRSSVGFGSFGPGARNVTVHLGDVYVGNKSYVTKGPTVRAQKGSTLDIWVEDSSCNGSNIFYSQIGDYTWGTSMANSALLNLQKPAGKDGQLTLVSFTEGSSPNSGFPANPNCIGCPLVQSLVSDISVAGKVFDQKTEFVPPSQGQGHLTFTNSAQVPYGNLPASFSASLRLATNLGYVPFSGPALLFAVFENNPNATANPIPLACRRLTSGISCKLSNGATYSSGLFSDASGWAEPMYSSTVEFADIDGDGALDVCGRASSQYICYKWKNGGFSQYVGGPLLSNANGWYVPQYYQTIHLADVNGDGLSDVCARAGSGVFCWLSNGAGFDRVVTGPSLSDANGYADPIYNSTVRYLDVNGDGKADVCALTSAGDVCWLSSGNGFSAGTDGPVF